MSAKSKPHAFRVWKINMKHIKWEMLEEFLQKAGRPSACLETFQSLKPFAGSKNKYGYIW